MKTLFNGTILTIAGLSTDRIFACREAMIEALLDVPYDVIFRGVSRHSANNGRCSSKEPGCDNAVCGYVVLSLINLKIYLRPPPGHLRVMVSRLISNLRDIERRLSKVYGKPIVPKPQIRKRGYQYGDGNSSEEEIQFSYHKCGTDAMRDGIDKVEALFESNLEAPFRGSGVTAEAENS